MRLGEKGRGGDVAGGVGVRDVCVVCGGCVGVFDDVCFLLCEGGKSRACVATGAKTVVTLGYYRCKHPGKGF